MGSGHFWAACDILVSRGNGSPLLEGIRQREALTVLLLVVSPNKGIICMSVVPFISEGCTKAKLFSFIITLRGESLCSPEALISCRASPRAPFRAEPAVLLRTCLPPELCSAHQRTRLPPKAVSLNHSWPHPIMCRQSQSQAGPWEGGTSAGGFSSLSFPCW